MNPTSPIPSAAELRAAFDAIKGTSVPAIPDILIKLNHELSQAEPDHHRITELILQEQTLTGMLIKTANAPAFGLHHSIASVPHAVTLLGLQRLKNLLLGSLIQQHMRATSALARQIWQDSLEVSKAALRIAETVEGLSPDEAYLAGLLQDCGAMLMAEKWPDYEPLWQQGAIQPVRITAMEEHRYGTNHSVVGYLFGRHWKLPERINKAIYAHHTARCDLIEDSHTRALVAAIKLAGSLVNSRYLDAQETYLERIQFQARARGELMMDASTYALLEQEAAIGFSD